MSERKTIDSRGKVSMVIEVPNSPGGIRWLPDGTLLVVSTLDLKMLRFGA